MAFSPVFLLASVFRAVGRRQRVHPFSQDHDTDDALPADTRGNECKVESPRLPEKATVPKKTVRESKDLLEAGKRQVPGNKVSLISKKHDILLESNTKTTKGANAYVKRGCLNDKTSLSLEQRMEIFWSKKSLIQREFYSHEYGPEDSWKGLYRELENLLVFDDPGLELFIAANCHIRNRYRTVLPYVGNRVKLVDGPIDYINASYVTMKEVERNYIVTQGPLENTVPHFWEMVWQHKSAGIIMLCRRDENGRDKCAQYWPPTMQSSCVIAGFFMIECRGNTQRDCYTVTSLEILNLETQETHTLKHFHYYSWPDFGVPLNERVFVNFLMDVRSSGVLRTGVGPAIVHCSAGVGRSGVFTLTDVCVSSIQRTGSLSGLDVTKTLIDLRRQRLGLIQTHQQLKFTYLSILNAASRILSIGQSVKSLKKEVENEMAAAVSQEQKQPKLVYIHHTRQCCEASPLCSQHSTSWPGVAAPAANRPLTVSLPSLFSDTNSVFSLSDMAADSPAPSRKKFKVVKKAEVTTAQPCNVVRSSSTLSIVSVESSDLIDVIEAGAPTNEATGGPKTTAKSRKKSWFKKLKKIFRRKNAATLL